jgi:uncharacterized protein (DUF2461 family)
VERAAAFFAALSADNSRAFWDANRTRYDRDVRAPFAAVLEAIGTPAGPWRVYRPHNDTRFGTTAPLKDFAGAVASGPDGVGFFVRVDARGVLAASGIPMMERDQLARFRAAVAGPAGGDLAGVVAAHGSAGTPVTGGRYPPLTAAPRGFRRDHPRIALLRWRGVERAVRLGIPGDTAAAVVRAWESAADLHAWLGTHVGPSGIPPERIWGRGRRRGSPA